MPDSKLPDLAEVSVPTLDDLLYFVDVNDTTDDPGGSSRRVSVQRLLGQMFAQTFQARLTTETAVPVSITNRAAQGTLFLTPYHGNKIALYDGTRWRLYSLSEISLSLTGLLVANSNYDVFVYDNSGTLTLELSAAWASDTARTDTLALQDGVFVKSAATTRRYIGTIRATGTGTIEDSESKRFLWNMYNRVRRHLKRFETTNTWTYDLTDWRQANGSVLNQLDFVVGQSDVMVEATVLGIWANVGSATVARQVGIGVNSTSSPAGSLNSIEAPFSSNAEFRSQTAHYAGTLAAGRHFLAWLERVDTGEVDTTIWVGDNGSAASIGPQAGMFGSLMG